MSDADANLSVLAIGLLLLFSSLSCRLLLQLAAAVVSDHELVMPILVRLVERSPSTIFYTLWDWSCALAY